MPLKQIQNSILFGEIQTSTVTFITYLTRFRLIAHSFKNPHRIPTEPMRIHNSPHTHPIPISMGIPMGISIRTASLPFSPSFSVFIFFISSLHFLISSLRSIMALGCTSGSYQLSGLIYRPI